MKAICFPVDDMLFPISASWNMSDGMAYDASTDYSMRRHRRWPAGFREQMDWQLTELSLTLVSIPAPGKRRYSVLHLYGRFRSSYRGPLFLLDESGGARPLRCLVGSLYPTVPVLGQSHCGLENLWPVHVEYDPDALALRQRESALSSTAMTPTAPIKVRMGYMTPIS